MTIAPGTRFGDYEITAFIGAGGMGAVFQAHDHTLNRDVAIKVLPDALANDAERLARFTREAQTLASLSHANIAGVHGLVEAGGVRALVMEMAAGEDLSERIGRGPIPLDDVLPLAIQIADAMEYAHQHGVIHRDLKPANIKVSPGGTVKVLDFGLAKALELPRAAGEVTGRDDYDAGDDAGRGDPGHRGVHEPRAGAGQAARQTLRRVGVWLRTVRDAHR